MTNLKTGTCDHDRRKFLKFLGKAGVGLGLAGVSLENQLFLRDAYGVTPDNPSYDAVVQVFFTGGPSQTDTFDPKPGSPNNVFGTIDLGVKDPYGDDVLISSLFPNLSDLVLNDPMVGLGSVRSMSHGTNNHTESRRFMFSFWEGNLAGVYPTMAPVMAHYFQGTGIGVPAVAIENGLGRRGVTLEVNLAQESKCPTALEVNVNGTGSRVVETLSRSAGVGAGRYDRRKSFVDKMNARYTAQRRFESCGAWERATQEAYDITSKGDAARAFDLSGVNLVPTGSTDISRRITLTQRLVDAGVPYVVMGIGGNDTHINNRGRHEQNFGDYVDNGVVEMVNRFKQSGKRVLIMLGGEFGRTPGSVAGGRDGRDHWGDGFTWSFISVNQPKFKTNAYGQTGPDGTFRARSNTLVDPVRPKDLGGFVYRAMGFDVGDVPGKFNIPMQDRTAPPVDRRNKSTELLQTFGLI
jgi:hypothetical protein